MNQNKLQILIESLDIDPIVFIDNDFKSITDAGIILFQIFDLNEVSRKEFLEVLSSQDNELSTEINSFIDKVKKISIADPDMASFQSGWIESAFLGKYNDVVSKDEIDSVIDHILEAQKSAEYSFEEMLLSVGIIDSESSQSYNFLVDHIRALSTRNIKFYKGLPGEKLNKFADSISEFLQANGAKVFFLIVDKKLEGEEGNEIVEKLITYGKGINLKNFIAAIYTSQEGEILKPQILSDGHLLLQLNKPKDAEEHDNTTNKLSQCLAFCAYGLFFNSYINSKKEVIAEVGDLLINENRTHNVIYLAEQAYMEGTTVYKTIDHWVNLIIQKKLVERFIRESDPLFSYYHVSKLTSVFRKDFFTLDDFKADNSDFDDLTSFEIFDNKINEFHSPISAGDIFVISGDKDRFFVLAGQDCDLIVRKNGDEICRKEHLAELIEADIYQKRDIEWRKISDKSREDIEIDNFSWNGNNFVLKIHLNKRYLFDFRLLDLTVLNNQGDAQLVQSIQDVKNKDVLPRMWQEYLPNLISSLHSKVAAEKILQDNNIKLDSLLPNEVFNLMSTENDGVISFPIKRICRIKGSFNRFFQIRLGEYKNRLALDTINVDNRQKVDCVFKYKFSGGGNPVNAEGELSIWKYLLYGVSEAELPLLFYRDDIKQIIPEPHREYLNGIVSNEIIIKEKHQYIGNIAFKKNYIKNGDKFEITLELPLTNQMTGEYFAVGESYFLSDILCDEHIEALSSQEQFELSIGNAPYTSVQDAQITFLQLKTGVNIPFLNLNIKLDIVNGLLKGTPVGQ